MQLPIQNTPYGRVLLLRERPANFSGLEADWILGANLFRRHCVLLEYTLNPRMGFARAGANSPVHGFVIPYLLLKFMVFTWIKV